MAAAPTAAAPAASGPAAPRSADDWATRIRLAGDFRFRHETIDNGLFDANQTRQTIRARLGASICASDDLSGDIAVATGGREPRGASSTLGAASSREDIGSTSRT